LGWAAGHAVGQVRSAEDDDWEIVVSADEIIEVRRLRAITLSGYGEEGDPVFAAAVQARDVASDAETATGYQHSRTWSAKHYGTQYEFEFPRASKRSIRLLHLGLAALAAAGLLGWLLLR
jgi:hypothetical protein